MSNLAKEHSENKSMTQSGLSESEVLECSSPVFQKRARCKNAKGTKVGPLRMFCFGFIVCNFCAMHVS